MSRRVWKAPGRPGAWCKGRILPTASLPLAPMSSDAAEPEAGWGKLAECGFGGPRSHQGSLRRNSISSPRTSQLRPLRADGLWPGPAAVLPPLSQPRGHWRRARPGGLPHSESYRAASVLTHLRLSAGPEHVLLGSHRPPGSPPRGADTQRGQSPLPLTPTSLRQDMDSRRRESALLEAQAPSQTEVRDPTGWG